MEFSVNYTLTEEAISDILSNGLWEGYCGFDDVYYDEGDYIDAKNELVDEGKELTIENVEARIIMSGKHIKLHELEAEYDRGWHKLDLQSLIRGLTLYARNPINGTIDDVLKSDPQARLDADDYDAILQYACFGEILFG